MHTINLMNQIIKKTSLIKVLGLSPCQKTTKLSGESLCEVIYDELFQGKICKPASIIIFYQLPHSTREEMHYVSMIIQ